MAISHLNKLIGLSLISLLAVPSQAQAQTVGDVVNNVAASFASFPFILSAMFYISGIFFAIWGIFKFKDHVDNPTHNPLSAGIKRFLAGGMLLTGPYMYDVIVGSLFAGSNPGLTSTGRNPTPGGGGMDQMIVDFVSNIYEPITLLLISFTYISAIALLLVGIHRLIKTAQDGPRGPTGMGTIVTFLASGALFSFGDMLGTFSTSLFGDATVSTFASISPTVISNAADAARISAVVEAVMAFIMIVGYIAFIRGWFVLRSFADGNGHATLAQGLTFLFGGALAINLGELINVLQTTLGISGITFT